MANKTGTAGNDTLSGTTSVDVLIGLAGSDSLIGEAGDDYLEGGDGSDSLDGGTGNDVLAGGTVGYGYVGEYAAGTGVDTLQGGAGDDMYYVNTGTEVIVEAAGAGIDTLVVAGTSPQSITLMANIENVQGGVDYLSAAENAGSYFAAYNVTGNALNNVMWGSGGANNLFGESGDDSLYGAGGDDVLNGGSGADVLYGGGGSDTYFVDSASDVVVEDDELDEGIDLVVSTASFDMNLAALDGLEGLELTGTSALTAQGNGLNNVMLANGAGCTLSGLGGNDDLFGGDGNDRLEGGDGDDVLLGAAGSDWIFGGAGDDQIAGDQGQDYLYGGDGSDTYLYGSDFGADVLFDGAGTLDQVVFTDVSYERLWFSQNGQSLVVQEVSTQNLVFIENWFAQADGVEQFVAAEGHVLDESRIAALVTSMSSFAPQDIATAPAVLRSAVDTAWGLA